MVLNFFYLLSAIEHTRFKMAILTNFYYLNLFQYMARYTLLKFRLDP